MTMTNDPVKFAADTELFSLRGKVALITGATGHLGGAMADALAEAGARVIVSSRTLAHAQAVAARLAKIGDAAHLAVAIDHTDEISVQEGFDDAVRHAGRVDVVINNGHEPLGADWTTVTADQFTRHMANATGYFLLARHFHAHAVSRGGGGVVIMIGSMYGSVGSYPDAYADISAASPVAYHALKGGILQMTRHLAVYWAKDGVRVNCLSPGPFPSPKASSLLVERLIDKSPIGRMGRPEELKGPLVFLASDASSYMTGQNLVIDGGWTAW
ncbi:MAG TPA: SDR family oxidoreductase [Tepidisphaeraceae bacterium]|jgi:gluconate 5-dehydrogenase|nr:SDR family oxidoreductase [Tepidisphaeraceae bacterium]